MKAVSGVISAPMSRRSNKECNNGNRSIESHWKGNLLEDADRLSGWTQALQKNEVFYYELGHIY